MRDPLVGRTIAGKFVLDSRIGSGAMGAVYKARHLALDTVVAVKVMHREYTNDETFAGRFHREARAASRLDHVNVIRVIDFGTEPDGCLYIVMEYVDGSDLFRVMHWERPLSEARIIDLLAQTLSGIAAAHDVGIVHRDLKPENIMVVGRVDDEGSRLDVVKVCDFGIAQITEPTPRAPTERALTTRGILLGTPQYMSPEQCRGEVLDARSDLYSLGVILYQLLTDRLPFEAASPIDVVLKHISEEPAPPITLVPGASTRLSAVCLRALSKRREDRYANAREMRAAIRADSGSAIRGPALVPKDHGPDSSARTRLMPASPIPPATLASPGAEGDEAPASGSLALLRKNGALKAAWTYSALGALALTLLVAAVLITKERDAPALAPSAPARSGALATSERTPSQPEPSRLAFPAPSSTKSESAGKPAKPPKPPAPRRAALSGALPPPAPLPPLDQAQPPPPPKPAAVQLAPVPELPEASKEPGEAPQVSSMPAAPRLRPSSGRVIWKVAAVGGGATAGGVVRALSRAAGSSVEGAGTLRLTCDDQGRVVGTMFAGIDMPDVVACIRGTATGLTIPNADTGEAWATVALSFDVID